MLSFPNTTALDMNGARLACAEAGKGDAVVLVHGSVSDLRTWDNQLDVLAGHFRTIAYSRRYHRPNDPIAPEAADPIQAHVDDLAGLIERLDAAPAHVVGHSWGGLIVLMLALQNPQLCRSLVLIEPPAVSLYVRVPPGLPEMIGLLVKNPRLALAIARLGGGALAQSEKAFRRGDDRAAIEYFGRGVLGNHAYETLSDTRYRQIWDNRAPDRALALHHGFPDLTAADLSKIAMPVLLLTGTESPKLFRLIARDLCRRLPNARKTAIAGASHIVHEDAPDAVNTAIREFIQAQR